MYLVGGSVRDLLLELTVDDYDFVFVAYSWEHLVELAQGEFGPVPKAGTKSGLVEFPDTFTLKGIKVIAGVRQICDIAAARQEYHSGPGHKPSAISLAPTLEEDLKRRDFTVNAMARDWKTGELVDLYGGRADLSARVLRCVGNTKERLLENPDRVIRAFYFQCKLGFTFSKELEAVLRESVVVQQAVADDCPDRKAQQLAKLLKKASMTELIETIAEYPQTWAAITKGLKLKFTT
jgi:tRNA nucleotidyltransferase (CCA-adding enzyme)